MASPHAGRSADARWALVLLGTYTVAVGFSFWPAVSIGEGATLPEMVFLGVALVAMARLARPAVRAVRSGAVQAVPLDLGVAVWVAAVAALAAVHDSTDEALIAFYLGSVYLVVRTVLAALGRTDGLEVAGDALVIGAVCHGVVGVIGWTLSYAAGNDVLATVPAGNYFPVIGTIGRASGATWSPTMLAALLTPGWLVAASRLWARRGAGVDKLSLAALLLISAGLLLTFSKSMLILIPAMAVVTGALGSPDPRRRRLTVAASVLSFVLLMAMTHVWIHRVGDPWAEVMRTDGNAPGVELVAVGPWRVDTLNYVGTKQAAFLVGVRNPFAGVGPGGFIAEVPALRAEGRYDPDLPDKDPHSTYVGTFAELGLVGLCALALLIVAAWRTATRASTATRDRGRPEVRALVAALVCMAIEAVNTDVANFRIYWVVLGAVAAAAGSVGQDAKSSGFTDSMNSLNCSTTSSGSSEASRSSSGAW